MLTCPYLDKLEHIQVVINCQYSVAQMCNWEDTLTHYLGAPYLDDVMSQNELTTMCILSFKHPALQEILWVTFYV